MFIDRVKLHIKALLPFVMRNTLPMADRAAETAGAAEM